MVIWSKEVQIHIITKSSALRLGKMSFLNIWRNSLGKKVSARKMRLLSQEVERFERMVKGSQGYSFFDWDFQAKYIFWSGGFWEFLGYDTKEIDKATDPDRFLDLVYVDDRELLRNIVGTKWYQSQQIKKEYWILKLLKNLFQIQLLH